MTQLSNNEVYNLSFAEYQRKILAKALKFALDHGVDFTEEVVGVSHIETPTTEASVLCDMLEDMKGDLEIHHGLCF